jgi:2-polyprenyl-6-methoxyphenol hydroxylase-like FAD-dependent oxidoreductase
MTPRTPVLIAGGGIGGLATALTLHQIGVPCLVFESVREMKPEGCVNSICVKWCPFRRGEAVLLSVAFLPAFLRGLRD